MRRILLSLLLVLTAGATACSTDEITPPAADSTPQSVGTVVEVAAADGRFATLVTALRDTGLDAALSQPGPFTVFAPTDAAFALLPAGLVAGLSPAQLADILRHHVVSGAFREADVLGLDSAPTLGGGTVRIQVSGSTVVLDGRVQITTTDVEADNGVIHVIDAVLVPGAFPGTVVDVLAASPRFSTLAGAVGSAGLAGTLSANGPFTVLAPTDRAFGLLPSGLIGSLGGALADVLRYHVIPGDVRASTVVTLSSATTDEGSSLAIQVDAGTVVLDGRVQVTFTDITTANGVIHVLDAVLVPGDFPGTIVDVLAASPRFSTLVDAVGTAGLAGTLATDNGGAGFTVFAPTNAGFDRLPDGLLDSVAMAGDLGTVLLYHALGAEVDSAGASAADGSTVQTLATDPNAGGAAFLLAVDLDADQDLFLDGRTEVTFTDIRTRNGIVHVLDSVLIPGGDFPGTLVEALGAYPRFDTLVGAVVAEGLAGAVTGVTVFAPTNDAFAGAALGGLVLADVLAYHLLPTPKVSTALAATETTVLGDTISIDTSMGVVINHSATVVRADIAASDGVIHVIDDVLVP
jgi:uncharacterized surface protein with fasciclin (FAS1) repeats